MKLISIKQFSKNIINLRDVDENIYIIKKLSSLVTCTKSYKNIYNLLIPIK